MDKRFYIVGAALAVFALTAGSTSANGLGGTRLEAPTGDYIIDVGTSATGKPQAGQAIQFDYQLLKKDTRAYVEFTSVAVKIAKGNTPLFNGELHFPFDGPILLTYVFPGAGDYQMTVTFYNKGGKFVEGAIPTLKIDSGSPSSQVQPGPGTSSSLAAISRDGKITLRLQQKVDNYNVDIGTDKSDAIAARDPVAFNARLLQADGKTPVDLTDVDMNVIQVGTPYLDADVVIGSDNAGHATFAFPYPGIYQLNAFFYNKDEQIAQGSFPYVIVGPAKSGTGDAGSFGSDSETHSTLGPLPGTGASIWIIAAVAAVIVSTVLIVLKRRRSRRHTDSSSATNNTK
jgi:hypothetical protein